AGQPSPKWRCAMNGTAWVLLAAAGVLPTAVLLFQRRVVHRSGRERVRLHQSRVAAHGAQTPAVCGRTHIG
ncbi:MAG: hypothetical protein ACRDXB_09110, partial [Actinomycetes bacterium]